MSSVTELEALSQNLREFAAQRDWDQYHSPKNLAMALIVEAAELVEHFQWLTPHESNCLSPDKLDEVATELADILIYLVRLADRLEIDLMQAVSQKIETNAIKYPIPKSSSGGRREGRRSEGR